MKAIHLPEYQGNIIRALRSLEIVETEIPGPAEDEVIIEIEASPCNPSDLAFIQGGYNVRKALPAIPGFEGAGKVISTGKKQEALEMMGKRVSFFSQSDSGGSWASLIAVKFADCIEIGTDLATEQAACFSVNPFTAYAMVDLAKKSGTEAIIQNASGGQVAKFINVLAELEGMEVINIVRKEEQVDALKTLGYKHILLQQDEDFQEELTRLSDQYDARIAFDAVGGEHSGHILKAMPENSTLFMYGALGARTLSEIPATDVIFKNKIIRGFNMNEWKDRLGAAKFKEIAGRLQQMFIDGTLTTQVQGSYKLEDFNMALMSYIRNMSGGKILLKAVD